MKKLRVTVDGKAYEVSVQLKEEPQAAASSASTPAASATPVSTAVPPSPATPRPAAAPAGPGSVPSPLAGKVVSIDVQAGQEVTEGQQLLTLEAMKMNTYVNAPKAGKVAEILAAPGDAVEEGQALIQIA